MKLLGRFLTFSNVVACLALFIALGGSVYAAGKISGKQIKAKSLPGNRLKPKTITARQIKPKTITGRQIKAKTLTGRQVRPRSLKGSEIDQKTLTEVSAASLSSIHYEAVTAPLPGDGRLATATANCPGGSYVIGGGATVSNDLGRIKDGGPSPLRTGWRATGFAWYSGTASMTVTAVCVAVEKPGGAAHTATPAVPESGPKYQPFP